MKITGIHIYYYFVCHRKLWYFDKGITMEDTSEDVKIGRHIDESSYARDEKHINIDNVINIDFLRNSNILHEVKKSKSIEEASIWQVKYYLYYLYLKGANIKKARIDYPQLRESRAIELNEEDFIKLQDITNEIINICNRELPSILEKKKICRKCAYYEICFI
jgi:CRISPR-associated exonuclease Cas4